MSTPPAAGRKRRTDPLDPSAPTATDARPSPPEGMRAWRFSTNSYPVAERRAAWREVLTRLGLPHGEPPEDAQGCRGVAVHIGGNRILEWPGDGSATHYDGDNQPGQNVLEHTGPMGADQPLRFRSRLTSGTSSPRAVSRSI